MIIIELMHKYLKSKEQQKIYSRSKNLFVSLGENKQGIDEDLHGICGQQIL